MKKKVLISIATMLATYLTARTLGKRRQYHA
jgi:hypothetical protein